MYIYSMNTSVCMCMYVCMYVCVTYFVFILYICIWLYWVDGNKFMYVLYVCMYVCMQAWKHVYVHKYVCHTALICLHKASNVSAGCQHAVDSKY